MTWETNSGFTSLISQQTTYWTAVTSKWITVSINEGCILFAFLSITQWPLSMTAVIEMMLWPNPSNWLVCLLSIKCQVSVVVEQDSSLTQDRLVSQKNFRGQLDRSKWHNQVDWIGFRKEWTSPGKLVFFTGMLLRPSIQTSETPKWSAQKHVKAYTSQQCIRLSAIQAI